MGASGDVPICPNRSAPTTLLTTSEVLPTTSVVAEPELAFDSLTEEVDASTRVKRVVVEQLVKPCLHVAVGLPLSFLAFGAEEHKHGLHRADNASKEAVSRFILERPEAPHTHRNLSIVLHERSCEIVFEARAFGEKEIARFPSVWLETARQEATARQIPLNHTSLFLRALHGVGSGIPSAPCATNDLRLHTLIAGNSQFFDGLLRMCQELIRVVHHLYWTGSARAKTGAMFACALRATIPQTTAVVRDLLALPESRYEVTRNDAWPPGVLRHSFRTRWNLEAIQRRWSRKIKQLIERRAWTTVLLEDGAEEYSRTSSHTAPIAMRFTEAEGCTMTLTFLTSSTGNLVWTGADGTPLMCEEQPYLISGIVPFRLRTLDSKIPIGGCGCVLNSAPLPSMVFSLDCVRDPYPIVSIRCLEVEAFLLEWFWYPLFNVAQMRRLLVHFLRLEVHFHDDEVHTLISAQIPLFGLVLRRIVRAMAGLILGVIFGPPAEDPFPELLAACGRDLETIEANSRSEQSEKAAMPAAPVTCNGKSMSPAADLLVLESSDEASTAPKPMQTLGATSNPATVNSLPYPMGGHTKNNNSRGWRCWLLFCCRRCCHRAVVTETRATRAGTAEPP